MQRKLNNGKITDTSLNLRGSYTKIMSTTCWKPAIGLQVVAVVGGVGISEGIGSYVLLAATPQWFQPQRWQSHELLLARTHEIIGGSSKPVENRNKAVMMMMMIRWLSQAATTQLTIIVWWEQTINTIVKWLTRIARFCYTTLHDRVFNRKLITWKIDFHVW